MRKFNLVRALREEKKKQVSSRNLLFVYLIVCLNKDKENKPESEINQKVSLKKTHRTGS